jgi:hypothetical protein
VAGKNHNPHYHHYEILRNVEEEKAFMHYAAPEVRFCVSHTGPYNKSGQGTNAMAAASEQRTPLDSLLPFIPLTPLFNR